MLLGHGRFLLEQQPNPFSSSKTAASASALPCNLCSLRHALQRGILVQLLLIHLRVLKLPALGMNVTVKQHIRLVQQLSTS